jgi:uncharacterized membrane protein SirB2
MDHAIIIFISIFLNSILILKEKKKQQQQQQQRDIYPHGLDSRLLLCAE